MGTLQLRFDRPGRNCAAGTEAMAFVVAATAVAADLDELLDAFAPI